MKKLYGALGMLIGAVAVVAALVRRKKPVADPHLGWFI